MNQLSRREHIAIGVQFAEYGAYIVACWGALWLAFGLDEGPVALLRSSPFLDLGCIGVLAAGFVFGVLPGLVGTQVHRLRSEWSRKRAMLRDSGVVVAVVALGAIAIDREILLDRAFLLALFVLLLSLRIGCRFALRHFALYFRRRDRNLRHVVVVGSGPRARAVLQSIEAHPELGYLVLGCVDDPFRGATVDLPRLGDLGDFERILTEQHVDEVFMALPMRSLYDAIVRISSACEEQGIAVHVLADPFAPSVSRAETQYLGAHPLLTIVSSGPMGGLAYLAKRTLDRVGGLLLLLMASPLLGLISLGIWITMGRPIFYAQPRVGYRRRVFNVLKFRTMVLDAESQMAALEDRNEMDGPVFKLRDDPRVTPFGAFLRRYSLDELPQILNVVKGEMSLVGPRPLPLRDVSRFDRPALNRRFSVWPGITCTWQISGRNDLSFEDWIRLDLEYVDQWSFSRDCEILLRTVPAVIGRKGAY